VGLQPFDSRPEKPTKWGVDVLMSAETLASLGSITAILGWVVAALAFFFGLLQYKKGQNWQRGRIILSLIDSFEKNKRIEMACTMLDWDERDIPIDGGKILHFKNDMLVSALRAPEMDVGFTDEENMIRDAFDEFFDFFYKLYAFKKSKLLHFSDFTYFYYWFELLRNIGGYKKNKEIGDVIDNYLDAYCFAYVKELLKEYSRKPDPILKDIFKHD
jgi:hypothetical protein